jgi:hypothetical protein
MAPRALRVVSKTARVGNVAWIGLAFVLGCAQTIDIGEWQAPPADQPTCADDLANGLETDIDCGGDACGPCKIGNNCQNDADCDSLECTSGTCVPYDRAACFDPPDPDNPTCADCMKNGLETDKDCGGDSCDPCAPGLQCFWDNDCESGVCQGATPKTGVLGTCVDAARPTCQVDPDGNETCADCVLNGLETDTDCGGDACPPCPVGKKCNNDADCDSGHCDGGVCGDSVAFACPTSADPDNATCADCVRNGSETDIDCGGDACQPCVTGKACQYANDCKSKVCLLFTCM